MRRAAVVIHPAKHDDVGGSRATVNNAMADRGWAEPLWLETGQMTRVSGWRAAPEANSEAAEFANDLAGESLQTLAEKILLPGAPKAIEFGPGFIGHPRRRDDDHTDHARDLHRSEIDSVPVTYLILA